MNQTLLFTQEATISIIKVCLDNIEQQAKEHHQLMYFSIIIDKKKLMVKMEKIS